MDASLPERLNTHISFFLNQRVKGFEVPEDPHFVDEKAGIEFERRLRHADFYLEYGSGGSTLLAARFNKRFITVDSDKYFLRAVERKIPRKNEDHVLLYADVGLNGPWGIPVFKSRTKARERAWASYPLAPWRHIEQNECSRPDLILIDGRFRVACALTCLQHLKDDSTATILIDDYLNRPHFQIIEDFAHLEGTAGQMAVFRSKTQDRDRLADAIRSHVWDWR